MPFTRVVCCNCNILTVSQDLKQKKRPRLHTIKYVASEDIQMRSGKIIELSNLTNIANCSEIQNTHVSENLRCEDIKCYRDRGQTVLYLAYHVIGLKTQCLWVTFTPIPGLHTFLKISIDIHTFFLGMQKVYDEGGAAI